MLRKIEFEPAQSVDGRYGYHVSLAGTQVGTIWLPARSERTYGAHALCGESDMVRVQSLGEALNHILHRARNLDN